MLDMLRQNQQAINTIVNVLMLLVWAFYFQMLFNAHRRGLRAKILINRSAGQNLSAQCVISNMSAGVVYLEAVVIFAQAGDRTHELSLTDLSNLTKEPEGDRRAHWFQGPLTSGEFISLGSFENLLQNCAKQYGLDMSCVDELDVLVVATYGPDQDPVGARRKFRLDSATSGEARWKALPTRQLRSFWRRRGLRRFMRDAG